MSTVFLRCLSNKYEILNKTFEEVEGYDDAVIVRNKTQLNESLLLEAI